MDRRSFLIGVGAAAGAAWARPAWAAPGEMAQLPDPPLPPDGDRLNILAGLRPTRTAGPRIAFAPKGQGPDLLPRAMVHNYGHGGGGITLSWGSAREAARLAFTEPARAATKDNQMVVLGAGIVGLATAQALLDEARRRNVPLQILLRARDLPGQPGHERIVSSIAGGQFAPSFGGAWSDDLKRRLLTDSLATFRRHAAWGVEERINYAIGGSAELDLVDALVTGRAPGQPLRPIASPFRRVACQVFAYRTYLIEPPRYMRSLWTSLLASGKVTPQPVDIHDPTHLNELPDTLIVNCMGLGAKAIAERQNKEFFGTEGQIVRYRPADYSPSRFAYLYSGVGYIFPRSDYIVIGGSADPQPQTETAAHDPKQAYGREIVRVHRQVFAGQTPPAFPSNFSGASRMARCLG